MSPIQKKRRGERFVSRPGDSVPVNPGEDIPRPRAARAVGGLELGELRRARNITQTELAGMLGIDQAQISRLESREDSRLSTVLEYLKGLGVVDVELRVVFSDGAETSMPLLHVRAGRRR